MRLGEDLIMSEGALSCWSQSLLFLLPGLRKPGKQQEGEPVSRGMSRGERKRTEHNGL